MVGMGKRARQANRVSERLRKEVEANQVHVAVVVSPTSDLDLGDVMTLVRPALLYADKVTLHSPKTQLLASMAALPALSDNPALDLIVGLDDETITYMGGDPATIEQLRQLRGQPGLGGELVEELMAEVTATANAELKATIDRTLAEAGAAELDAAMHSGLLGVAFPARGLDAETMGDDFMAAIGKVLDDPRILPLFDEGAAGLTAAALAEGWLVPGARQGGYNRAAAGAGLLAMLPSFPSATTLEVLDIRSDVAKPLAAYRREVADLSTALASQPWEPAFPAELDELWREKVQPTLDELSERLAETSFLRQLGPRLVKPADLLKSGAVAWCASSLVTRADRVTAAAGVATAGISAVAGAARDSRRRVRDVAGSGLWLLHHVEQRLGQ